ncbi:MAG: bifunctional pyr operon transcriptional regulator/uracil phosphoribosyltransferase PyrR [Bacteroidota bacterium]
MQKRLILNAELLSITVDRLCQQLIENHQDFSNTVILGLQPRGIHFSDLLVDHLNKLTGKEITYGQLDTTFYRDDFRMRETPKAANATNIDFIIEDKEVILVDDVLFTGRTIRAALDAMMAYGRPKKVELMVLINRKYTRDLPISPDYIGKDVNTMETQRVLVDIGEGKKNKVWLINEEE